MDTRKRWGVEGILRLGLFLWLVVAIGTVTAKGQVETTSRINGTVSDPSGAVVPGATVTVKNEGTGATREATTDAGGSYSFPSLPPGTYAITVSQSGFKKAEVTGRVIQVAQPAQVDLTLQLGTTSETITVSGAGAELISTTSAEVSGTVNSTLVTEIPLKRQNFFELLALIPGTTRQDLNISSLSFVGQALNFVQAGNTFTASGIFVAGNRDNATNVSVDGANVQSSVYQQTIQLQSPASVQEMRVESASMSAEFGGGAAAVNVITKSGTGTYHGELYEFFRNNHLDAAPFFTNLAGEKLPNYQQNQFGAALGGPIRKEKLLFFGNYEGFRVRESSAGHHLNDHFGHSHFKLAGHCK